MLTPIYDHLDERDRANAEASQFLAELEEEASNDKALGEYDARTGYFPRYASDAYLAGYCEGIKAIAHSDETVTRPGYYPFLEISDDEDLPF